MHSLVIAAPNLRPYSFTVDGYDGCYAMPSGGEQNAECTGPSLAFVRFAGRKTALGITALRCRPVTS